MNWFPAPHVVWISFSGAAFCTELPETGYLGKQNYHRLLPTLPELPPPGRKDLFLPFREGLRDMDCPLQQQTWPSRTALGLLEQQVQLSRALPDSFQYFFTAPTPSFYTSFSLAGAARPLFLRGAKFGFESAVEPALSANLQHVA